MSVQIFNALRRHGIVGILRLLPKNIAHAIGPLSPRRRAAYRLEHRLSRTGIDTARVSDAHDFDKDHPVARHAVRYEATSVEDFQYALSQIQIDFGDYTFVDFGSGKGRVCFLAGMHSFRRVIGIEFHPRIHEIACQNLQVLRQRHMLNCDHIDLICDDARKFVPDPTPHIFYMYNPFDTEILAGVLDRISGGATAGDSFIIYLNPKHRQLIDAHPAWRLISERRPGTAPGMAIYRGAATSAEGGGSPPT